MKFKCVRDQEFVIGGYTAPRGSRVGLGALLVGYHDGRDLVYAGKVGTGFDTATLRSLHKQLSGLEQDTSTVHPRPGRRARARAGCVQKWWRRSGSRNGHATASSVTRDIPGCAPTRAPTKW